MERKETSIRIFCLTVIVLILSVNGLHAQGQGMPFPEYGTGSIQVRIYTNYFCPSCRTMEPQVEPILQDLLKRNAITLIWVDTPSSRQSAFFTKYFLYALKMKNNVEHAFRVRHLLNDAASDRQMTAGLRISELFKGTEARLGELFKSNDIPYEVFEVRPILERYNALITEDKIQATPTCVIVRDGRKESFIGGPDIISALKRIL